MFKVATWNVNSIKVRMPHLLDWLATASPDVLAIQETKSPDDAFPLDEIADAGYNVVFSGQKSYNGVALLAKADITDIVTDIPSHDDPQRRILGATVNGVRILNLYVPNGQTVGSEKYDYKLTWLQQITRYIQEQLKEHPLFLTLGDFNIAPEDRDIHDPVKYAGQILCSDGERAAFQQFISAGLSDSFRLFNQELKQYTWWDYRELAFRMNKGWRIDHILISEELKKYCVNCEIDKSPRVWERPSDHTPVIATFDLK